MVKFQDDFITDDQSDAIALASAFQSANDNDIRSVMNAMSSLPQTTTAAGEESSSLKFYIVPASWFRKAFPILTARSPDAISQNWKEQIGRISNAELMNVVEREVSSDDDDENDVAGNGKEGKSAAASSVGVSDVQRKRFELMHRRIVRSRQHSTMKPGLVHTKDYFFLGSSTWMLVKEKFDFDGYELYRSCVQTGGGSSQNNLAIQLREEESDGNIATLIEIPASGRFPYEKVIRKGDSTSSTSAIVPEEEDGNNTESSFVFVPKPWDFNGEQDEVKSNDEPPVLLLPPSTIGQTGDDANPMMELDDGSNQDQVQMTTPPVFAGRKRLASGLANLGNTCFMNSSIQCLAHTDPLRNYFLSGDYARDLNRDNPLGTGGELATQFATLIGDMWGVAAKRRSVLGTVDSSQYSNNNNNYGSTAIYPRSFKYCLGKHAEQFVGYDQHDSQELATYLLDALHEDTNRVTKKPYIEIPEQGEDEPDEVAADKAWKLHLQREDSRVLENFMGQVKSRLECCQEGCNRVSTTFDPFMYLSVPIPGATDRALTITFVPLDPSQRMRSITLTLNKSAVMNGLMAKMNEELVKDGVIKEPVPLEDLCAADVWSHEVFSWYQLTTDIDRIRDSDKTFIYQLRTLSEVQEESKPKEEDAGTDDVFGQQKKTRKYKLDLETLTRLNKDEDWQVELEKYAQTPTLLYSLFNAKRATNEERLQFYKKLENFIDLCHSEITEEETTGTKRSRDGRQSEEKAADGASLVMTEKLSGLIDRSDTSTSFKSVASRQDVAILEFCANKLRQFILKMMEDKKAEHKDGVLVQVILRRPKIGSSYSSFVQPIVLRIPASLTVYGFRQLLTKRLSRALKTEPAQSIDSGEPSAEIPAANMLDSAFGSPELVVLRQVALAYERKGSYGSKSSSSNGKKLGMVTRSDDTSEDGTPAVSLAVSTDDSEKQLVAEAVGPNGSIFVDWSQELCDRFFDDAEFDFEEHISQPEDKKADGGDGEKQTTVMDCIQKYCQMEQLEETEMWYCNRCQDHVRAWKQFHLYRAPPILIIHLKRFHYSASTHRRNKITTFIDFPLEGLDLADLVSHYEEGEEPVYDCYAVSNHYGNLGGGHYTAYTLGDDGTWCHYDDSRVTSSMSPSEVITEAAYVLYYRRRDVEVGQDPLPILDDSQPAAVVVDQNEPSRDASEISSNHTTQAGDADDDDDNMAVDGDGSSRTSSSPISDMGSVDGGNDEQQKEGNVVSFVPGFDDADFPPLQ